MRNDKEVSKALYINGMRLTEISEKLDISINTLKSWSSVGKWTDTRIREENINSRVSRLIDTHLESIELKGKGNFSRDQSNILKDLMAIRQSIRVNFADRVNIIEDLIKYAERNSQHADLQAVAVVSKDYIDEEYNKLEE